MKPSWTVGAALDRPEAVNSWLFHLMAVTQTQLRGRSLSQDGCSVASLFLHSLPGYNTCCCHTIQQHSVFNKANAVLLRQRTHTRTTVTKLSFHVGQNISLCLCSCTDQRGVLLSKTAVVCSIAPAPSKTPRTSVPKYQRTKGPSDQGTEQHLHEVKANITVRVSPTSPQNL